jgi:hypothetical protein
MTQLRAVAIAALILGVGMAGQPLEPLHVLLAGAVLLLLAVAFERNTTTLLVFLFGFAGVLLACYVQHAEVYPGTGIVGLGLGGLAAASFGRPHAPAAIAVLGTLIGTTLFFLL